EGIKLARGLEKDLNKIERKVEILVNKPESPEDTPNLELFDNN
ncbi:MAG: exodeoxyribonuclease VII small subunit, partial [Spirochaetes bacterium]